jgi:hypothetical protein
MLSTKLTTGAATEVGKHFPALRGDRLAIALVGNFFLLEHIAGMTGAKNLNSALLEILEANGQLNDVYELEEVEDEDTLRRRLEDAFHEFLKKEVATTSHLLLWGLETLIYFGVNLRRIRQYAVNNRPIGLLIPGTVADGEVWFYDRKRMDCEFDQLWEVTL